MKRKLRNQYGRNFFLYIYALVHTFHHNCSKGLTCDVLPFWRERPFGPSKFDLEQGQPLGEDNW
jgi:hypothetical protein